MLAQPVARIEHSLNLYFFSILNLINDAKTQRREKVSIYVLSMYEYIQQHLENMKGGGGEH